VGGPAHGSVLSCGGAPRSDPISFPSSKPSPLYKHHHPAPRNHQFLHSQPPPLPTPNLIPLQGIHPSPSFHHVGLLRKVQGYESISPFPCASRRLLRRSRSVSWFDVPYA
jgi:hypothetical protein